MTATPFMRIAVTPGEPAGIGPDLLLQAAQQPRQELALIAVADPDLLQQRAEQLGLPLHLHIGTAAAAPVNQPGHLSVLPVKLAAPVKAGQLDPANAPYVLQCLDAAIDGCLAGDFDAMVTGPVHKGVINDAGIPFTGHTEYLACRTHTKQVVMLLATPGLRVALATTHLPLRAVADAITPALLENVLHILQQDLQQRFGLSRPRIKVCGLNPHAGEQGHLGKEDQEVLVPVIDKLRQAGMNLSGPYPADSLFTRDKLADTDAVLAMYHDQGLPVLKHMGFGQAVNVTLGLPLIRTSVDHGTALELAGSGRAHGSSLAYAIDVARDMILASRT